MDSLKMDPFAAKRRAREIVAEVEAVHGVPGQIFSRNVKRKVSDARTVAIIRVKSEFPHWSTLKLGAFFDRDHTTIVYALKKGSRFQWTDVRLREFSRIPDAVSTTRESAFA